MKLFTERQLNEAKYRDFLNLKCDICGNKYKSQKKIIIAAKRKNTKHDCCSKDCVSKAICYSKNVKPRFETPCKSCGSICVRAESQTKRNKNTFCSSSCAATYNNTHKKHGTKRSKLEVFLEKELVKEFPNLEFHFNQKDTINSELDIYIPSLKLAFELNGIFHYEPIFGEEKLSKIQNNDERKMQACLERGIELCIIDASGLKYFKPKNAEKYLNIIVGILKKKKGN